MSKTYKLEVEKNQHTHYMGVVTVTLPDDVDPLTVSDVDIIFADIDWEFDNSAYDEAIQAAEVTDDPPDVELIWKDNELVLDMKGWNKLLRKDKHNRLAQKTP